jgi:5-methylcytosine-specific restriction endonuclease McrA
MAYQPRPPRQALCRTCGTAWMVSGRGVTPKYCSDECKPKYESRPYDPATGAAAKRRRYWADPDKYRAISRRAMSTWRGRNPEQERDRVRTSLHRRRARKAGNGVFVISDRDQARLDASACVQCGSWDQLEEDHIIPISRGGSHGIGNLQVLCLVCNRSKNNKLQVEWLVARGELDERIRSASS